MAGSLQVSDFTRRARQNPFQRAKSRRLRTRSAGMGPSFSGWSHLSHPKILKSNVKPSARPPFVGIRRAQTPPRHFGP